MPPSSEIVIHEIDSAPFYQVDSRESHDLPYLVPVFRPVARIGTLLAHGLRLLRAKEPHGQAILEELRALRAQLEGLFEEILETRRLELERGPFLMVRAAVKRNEPGQGRYVALFLLPQSLVHSPLLFR
jgi:hypothetical protein